jgi:hypothetical protein
MGKRIRQILADPEMIKGILGDFGFDKITKEDNLRFGKKNEKEE